MKILSTVFLLLLVSTTLIIGQVSVTPANLGIDIARSTSANGGSPGYTTFGDIIITEGKKNDISVTQTNVTLILTAPSNWHFNVGVGTASFTPAMDITAMAINVQEFTITLTFSNDGNPSLTDVITISGIQVQSIDGNITPAAGNIVQTTANPGTAVIAGITNDTGIGDGTNFGSLSTDPVTPMPVELTSFSANISGDIVNLQWATATEVNNYGFEVQRSAVADEWDVLGFVEGHGNSNSPKEYEFIDDLSSLAENSPFDSLEYRLKQIDLDGSFEYYGTTAKVDLRNITDIEDEDLSTKFELSQNYPNPFNPVTKIQFGLKDQGNVVLTVFNVLGEIINVLVDESLGIGLHEVEFNASNLPSGIYFYQLQFHNQASGTGYSDIRKMILLK